jgi:hypothetical protein
MDLIFLSPRWFFRRPHRLGLHEDEYAAAAARLPSDRSPRLGSSSASNRIRCATPAHSSTHLFLKLRGLPKLDAALSDPRSGTHLVDRRGVPKFSERFAIGTIG